MSYKKTTTAISLIIAICMILFFSCTKLDSQLQKKEAVNKPVNESRRSARGDLPTFKEFIFSTKFVDSAAMTQYSENSKRTLLKYSSKGSSFRYMLVESSLDPRDTTWNSMYIISRTAIPEDFNFYSLEMVKDKVIDYNVMLSTPRLQYNVGVKVNDVMYDMDESIGVLSSYAPPQPGEDYCIDSWLVTYDLETGQIVQIVYSPICGTVNSGGGGGGSNPANPGSTCNMTTEQAQDILNGMTGEETNTYSYSIGPVVNTNGIIRKAKSPTWTFFRLHVSGNNWISWKANFAGYVYKLAPADPWKWETFQYVNTTQLGQTPICIDVDMNVSMSSTISSDGSKATAGVSFTCDKKVACGINWIYDSISDTFPKDFEANENEVSGD